MDTHTLIAQTSNGLLLLMIIGGSATLGVAIFLGVVALDKATQRRHKQDEAKYQAEGKPAEMPQYEWLRQRPYIRQGKPLDMPIDIWIEAQREVEKEDKRAIGELNKVAKQLVKQAKKEAKELAKEAKELAKARRQEAVNQAKNIIRGEDE